MFERYDAYKDSCVGLIGQIPENWSLKKLKFLTQVNASSLPENHPKTEIISYVDIGNVSFEKGISEVQQLKFSEAPSRARRLANCGDTVVSTVRTYLKAITYVDERCSNYVYSTGFAVLSPNEELIPKFLLNFVKSNSFTHQVDVVAKGMSYPAINSTELSNLWVSFPDIETQEKIVEFLDQKTSEIDQAIAIKEQQIALLNERKQIVIQKAVTQGLDPNVPMKDSGVEWIGQIPEHWECKPSRYAFRAVKRFKRDGTEIKFSVTQKWGVIPTDEMQESATQAVSFDGFQICLEDDLVLNKYKAHLGVFWRAPSRGLITGNYTVFEPLKGINSKYFELLYHTPVYIDIFRTIVYGVIEGMMPLYNNDFYDMLSIVPPLEEQLAIVQYVEEQQKEFSKIERVFLGQIEKLKEYKTTLINDAVTGKIKVA